MDPPAVAENHSVLVDVAPKERWIEKDVLDLIGKAQIDNLFDAIKLQCHALH